LYNFATPLASVVSVALPFFDPSGGPAGKIARPGVGPIVEFVLPLEAPGFAEPLEVFEPVSGLPAGATAAAAGTDGEAGALPPLDGVCAGTTCANPGSKLVAVAAAA
jgi:hypothetical protein